MSDMAQTMQDFKLGVQMLATDEPEAWKSFVNFMNQVLTTSAIDVKTKELVALGMGITARCKYCIGIHVEKAIKAGCSHQEILDVCTIAMMMGGGPALTYVAEVRKALELFEKPAVSAITGE